MSIITDDMVWVALEAGQREKQCWRVYKKYDRRDCVVVRDSLNAVIDEIVELPVGPCEETREQIPFRDEATAQRYIEWRAIKAALEAVR